MSCDKCDPDKLCAREDDVAMCVHCSQWWIHIPEVGVAAVSVHFVVSMARAPMPAEDVLAALDREAAEMVLG